MRKDILADFGMTLSLRIHCAVLVCLAIHSIVGSSPVAIYYGIAE